MVLRRRRVALCLQACVAASSARRPTSTCAAAAFSAPSLSLSSSQHMYSASPSRSHSAFLLPPPTPPRHSLSIPSRTNRRTRSGGLLASAEEDLARASLVGKDVASATCSTGSNDADSSSLAVLQEGILLGIRPTPEIFAIMTIYFVEGALGLARLAQTFLLKDTLHLGPAEMSALTGLFTLPWTVKPLYGFLSDGFPLFGYRRRSYLIVAGAVGCLSYTALGADFWNMLEPYASPVAAGVAAGVDATGAPSVAMGWLGGRVNYLQGTIAALVLSSACIAFSDVVADGIVVQKTRESDDPKVAGGLQSLCWGSAALGGLLSAYFSGSLLEVMGPREIFQITAVLPLLVATIAFFVDEKPVWKQEGSSFSEAGGVEGVDAAPVDGIKEQASALWLAMKQPAIWRPALFLFLWQSTPTGDGAMLYYMTNDLGFGPEFLGRARLVSAAATLVGVWGYQKYLRTVPIKDILFWTTVASAPLGMIQLLLITHANRAIGIPDGAFILGDDVVLSILGEFAFLPTLVLAARLCPPGVEAVLFATLMSIFNGASTVGTEVGAALTKYLDITESNFENLALLNVICSLSCLYPLLFIGWLDEVGSKSEEEQGEASEIFLDVPSGTTVDTTTKKGER